MYQAEDTETSKSNHEQQVVNAAGDGGEEKGVLALHNPPRPHDQERIKFSTPSDWWPSTSKIKQTFDSLFFQVATGGRQQRAPGCFQPKSLIQGTSYPLTFCRSIQTKTKSVIHVQAMSMNQIEYEEVWITFHIPTSHLVVGRHPKKRYIPIFIRWNSAQSS